MVLALVLILPATTLGFGWVNISRAYIEQLDFDTYRLRVEVEYGEFMPRPHTEGPFLHGFEIGTPLGAYNPTQNIDLGLNEAGEWLADDPDVSLTSVFGYDFDMPGWDGQPMVLGYTAQLNWLQDVSSLDGPSFVYAEAETHQGTIEVHAIPEPATMILLGLGLAGIGLARRFL